ncbi:CoB--CoM heterodisulfide reductase iron-sulfur subunit A family protein [Calderihabitans maritimus]|uniref:Fumarate reductase/succinate dehydrogenase flavoprotein domain-containing protein n=1 Tax=Calderihabitans maritimus TaxID=1246530 RepID=A0A1Z5HP63_9FIRM|nr:CoB--CoM heterodisulfide reductase iron-sulfur subunit A family protein [Calderihabitans maritimus]GAW91111.1 fumarate reductase/succinate dehydrogenase flavoprotein domain-containing protein [Calderihabitans maritimus]
MNAKIGVYVCHCGYNIAGKVDVKEVAEYAGTLDNVVIARDYKYMCSDPGQDLIKNDIKEYGLTRVVVASCSPRMHEPTFKSALEKAGLNGYLLEMANIREQCSWVTEDPRQATEKAKALVHGAVRRVVYHEPIEEREVGVNKATLVVGGGIAGIQATLKIAEAGHKVYLVEREPSIGGQMAKFDKTFPTMDCAACILTPKMVAVAQNPNVELLTYSEVLHVDGYVGNFTVTVKQKPRYVDVDKCTGCGDCQKACVLKDRIPCSFEEGLKKRPAAYIPFPQAVPLKAVIDDKHCLQLTKGKCSKKCVKACQRDAIDFSQKEVIRQIEVGSIILATGYELFDARKAPQYGYGIYDDVYTGIEFERITNASGPTQGKILKKNGEEPKRVAVLHCIGSRDENYQKYCSRVCCMSSVKFSHLVKEKTDAEVFEFYIDMRTFGKQYEEFYKRVQEEGVNFIRGKGAEVAEVNGQLVVRAEDTLLGAYREIPVDMVILNTALVPRHDADKVAQIFGISRSPDGFFLESHIKLDPVTTSTDGIYIAGCCQSPKDIPDSVAQGSAAAAEALATIATGKVKISPVTASSNPDICAGCRICIGLCPFKAITFNEEKKVAEINQAVCKGCGTCAAGCPSNAISIAHFNNQQILAEIEGVLR